MIKECADSDHRKDFFKKNKVVTDNLYFKVSPVDPNLPLDEVVADIEKKIGTLKDKKVR